MLHIKQILDVIISTVLLVVLLPVFICLAILVKVTSKGPAFFKWCVIGKDGKPIVSFNLDETLFTAGKAAVYVNNNDPIEFGKAIISLLYDEEKRKKMGEIGAARLKDNFTWEYSEKYLQSLYLKLLKPLTI